MEQIPQEQVEVIIAIERTTACLSIAGTLLIFLTFTVDKSFRTLSNTLIFYASFANIMSSVASLIGYFGILQGPDGALCQFQGFLLEMFMQSDPLWSLAMATNVYLVFFYRYDTESLKRLYWIYGIVCYGLPFIPAVAFLIHQDSVKGKIYGNAILWCWIRSEWALLRIISNYAPVWIAIFLTFIIYIRVGIKIYKKRGLLNSMRGHGGTNINVSGDPKAEPQSVSMSEPFKGTRTIEVEVMHGDLHTRRSVDAPPPVSLPCDRSLSKNQYSITITSPQLPRSTNISPTPRTGGKRQPNSMSKVKWAYTRCAALFAASILITWVPASINRVRSFIYPDEQSFCLEIASAIVLPLQGFWNTVIYFMTSWSICKKAWAEWRASRAARAGGPTTVDIEASSGLVDGRAFKLGEIKCVSSTQKAVVGESTVELSSSVSARSTSFE